MSRILQVVGLSGNTPGAPPPAPVPTTITVTGPDSVAVGSTAQYTVTVLDQNGNPMAGQNPVVTSSNTNILTVSDA